MARHVFAFDQQNALVLADLSNRRGVDGDRGLADAALRI